MSEENSEPTAILTPVEARVLGCLMEKQLTTPQNYPLSLNSLTHACNQKSNREPAMNLTEGEVGHTNNQLAGRDLVRIEYGERAQRISHRMNLAFTLNLKQRAIMTVLMLRFPQTLNEITMRTQRMAEFEGTDEIEAMLGEFAVRKIPLIKCLPKDHGQREDRYAHLLCGEDELPTPAVQPGANVPLRPAEEDRLAALEARIDMLESQVEALLMRFNDETPAAAED